MANERGRPLRRDELYIKTRKKNGVPSQNAEPIISPRSEENDVETNYVAQYNEDDFADHYDYMIVPRTNLELSMQQPPRFSPIFGLLPTTPTVQLPPPSSPIPAAPVDAALTRNVDAHHFLHNDLIVKEVILYAILRADQPVAKRIIISSNPSSILAGKALGKQYCEVVIKVVLKRDAKLPRPYAGVQEMADAKDLSIAWPYCKLKVSKASKKYISWSEVIVVGGMMQ